MREEWDANNPRVPVNSHGEWMTYPLGNAEYVDVEPWKTSMKIVGMETGRSSKVVVLESMGTRKKYRMFVADFVDGVAKQTFKVHNGGYLQGTWTVAKRGQNYGVKSIGV